MSSVATTSVPSSSTPTSGPPAGWHGTTGEGAATSCPSLRERKKSATRAALRRSAVALVAQRGLAAVTIEEIAAGADVSTRTFFNYFASKEDAVTGADPALVEEMVVALAARPADERPAEAMRAALLGVMASVEADHRDLLDGLRVVRSDPHLLAHHASKWAETERRLVEALALRRGTDAATDRYAALVVAVTLAASRVATLSWCDQEGRASLAAELAFHFDVLGNGLAEPERRAR